MNDTTLLTRVQQEAFNYFLHETNPANGLVLDKTHEHWPASIAATGLALTSYPAGVEGGLVSRERARTVTLTTLRFLAGSVQSDAPDATGYRGLYYHFLDMESGRRADQCELSTVDSALLLAGVLTAAEYFAGTHDEEREIRDLATQLYQRADWLWALNGDLAITHGWSPEGGFLPYRWLGYDEAMVLYILALGSPTHAITPASYVAWCAGYEWKRVYDIDLLYAGPLFTHQLSHVWVDFRGIRDAAMRDRGLDYFENSARATRAQQRYAMANPLGFADYHEFSWGITASDGPGDATCLIDGVERRFFDYLGRGVPFGPDDGTLAPWAVVASLPFAPDIVIPTIANFNRMRLRGTHRYGFKATFNSTFRDGSRRKRWVSPYHFGINLGPIVAMIENHRTGLIWELLRKSPPIVAGLQRAGFTGGWLPSVG